MVWLVGFNVMFVDLIVDWVLGWVFDVVCGEGCMVIWLVECGW